MIFTIVTILLFISSAIILLFAKKKTFPYDSRRILKILSIILLVVCTLKAVAADGFTVVMNGGELYGIISNKTDVIETIIRCGLLSSECLIFSLLVVDNKYVKWILSHISLPFITLSVLYFYFSVSYFANPVEFGVYLIGPIFASILLIIEYVLVFFISLDIHLFEKVEINDKNDIKSLIKVGVISQLICIPFLTYASLFGTTSVEMMVMNLPHIGWILSIPIIYWTIYFLFRNEGKETKLSILSVICFFLMIHMTSSLKVGYQTNRLPLQLCNLAPYLFVLLLFYKNKSLFNWIYVANPVGALIAVFTLAERTPIFSFWMIHYLVEHLYVFIVPILFVSFGVYSRPSIKDLLKDFFIWFSVYFGFCLLFNCIHNGLISPSAGVDYINNVNFFYLLDCPVKDVLPFYGALEFIKINLFGQEFFLGYIGFIYIVFSALSFLLYYIQEGLFDLNIHISNDGGNLKIAKKGKITFTNLGNIL